MGNKTARYLKISLVLVSFFCIFIFTVQTVCMNAMGEDAIRQAGVLYMSGTSEQIAAHFGTIIELRLSQVETLVDAVPPERFAEETPVQIELAYNARSIGFDYLAFYTEDEEFDMIYGSQVTADVPEALRRSVQGGKYNVCAGKDASGMQIVLMGVPAEYPMADGRTCIGLVAGLPASYLGDTLESSVESDMVEYYIIRMDGSYVVQNAEVEEKSYFERLKRQYETLGGKKPEQYEEEFREAIKSGEDYASEVKLDGKRWNVYGTKLPNSEWYLVLKMSHSELEKTVAALGKKWSAISMGGCALILGALLLVFWGYYRLMRGQMHALDEARRSADAARESAERSNRAKNEFLSNMSHDIRTPMNGIMGMTSIAIENLDNPLRVRACLKKINVSSRHLLGLLNDMLDMSKIESGRLTLCAEPVCLREVMQNIITIVLPQVQEKKQKLNAYVYDVYYENVCADRVRLNQILLNILGNAVKFTPEGGNIVVELWEEPSPKGEAYIRSRLHVGDNGIGMSEEFLGRIFEAFAREDSARVDKEAGAGMGLTIAKYIVDAMEGTISVKSKKGQGSDFYVAIDMEKAVKQEQDFMFLEREVLIVDDDETALKAAGSALCSIGLQPESARSAEQAFWMMERRSSQGNPYHMILLDWDIEGRSGIGTAEELRARFGAEVPILLLSDGENDELEMAVDEGRIDGMVVKPLFRSNLYYGLRRFAETEILRRAGQEETGYEELAGKRILVAEDNEMNWEIVEMLLSELGMELEWAPNGKICVEMFEGSELGRYDAVLMDIRMPVMSGLEAARAIRGLRRKDAGSIPIIAVSADAFAEDVQKCLAYGMNAHTSKPFDANVVADLLKQYLCKQPSAEIF